MSQAVVLLLLLYECFVPAGDLANMDALDPESAAKLPALMALRGAIYSPEFRQ